MNLYILRRPAIFFSFFILLFAPKKSFSIEVKPLVSYEYTAGSQDYSSHSGSGGCSLKFKNQIKLSAIYGLFTDTDYSLIQSGTLRLKGSLNAETALSAALVFSGGKLKDSNASSSSTSLNFEGTKYFPNHFEIAAGYRYTTGSLSSGVNREVRVTRSQKTGTRLISEEFTSQFSAHTLSSSAGYSFTEKLKGFFASFRLGVTFNSDNSRSYSEGLEGSYLFPREFSLGISYTLTQNSGGIDRNYLTLFISKYF